jgi:hypothetical protein
VKITQLIEQPVVCEVESYFLPNKLYLYRVPEIDCYNTDIVKVVPLDVKDNGKMLKFQFS